MVRLIGYCNCFSVDFVDAFQLKIDNSFFVDFIDPTPLLNFSTSHLPTFLFSLSVPSVSPVRDIFRYPLFVIRFQSAAKQP